MAADGSVEGLTVRLAQERLTVFQRIAAANEDLEERLRRLEVNVCYDRDDDVLVLTFGEPQEAITESIEHSLLLRLNPETLKIVGVEIPSLTRQVASHPVLADLWLAALRAAGARITELPEPAGQAVDRLAKDIRQLVAA